MNVSGINSLNLAASGITPKAEELSPAERARAAHLKGSALRNATPAEQRASVAGQFEAILVRQMLGKTLTSMVGNSGGAATSVYGDLLTESFAQQLTAGKGLGLARVIEKQLTPRTPAHPASSSAP